MKRIQALLLALLLTFTLCISGCSNTTPEPQATAEPEPTKEVIELTTSNWSKYLKAKLRYSKTEGSPFSYADYYDVSVQVYPVQGGHFNNVVLTLVVNQAEGSFIDSNHGEVSFEEVTDGKITYKYCYFNDLVLPSNGEYTTESTTWITYSSKDPNDDPLHHVVNVKEISGTFVPD